MTRRRLPSRRPPPAGRVRRTGVTAAVVGSLSLWATACGSSGGTLTTHSTLLGDVVADASGRVVYVYTQDRPGSLACTGDCAHDWPPALVRGRATAGSDVEASLIGTLRRPDGSRQITYAGHPLYRWVADTRGDLRGQAVGGVWFVIRGDGTVVRAPSPEQATFSGSATSSLTVTRSRLGPIVADSTGAPLYAFRDDTPTMSACVSVWCPGDWPPAVPTAGVSAAPGITAAVGTITRPDGLTQLTLGGHPLYRFSGDLHPGDLRGQGIGGDWLVVSPAGQPVGERS